jgi:serine/threonine protein kinase
MIKDSRIDNKKCVTVLKTHRLLFWSLHYMWPILGRCPELIGCVQADLKGANVLLKSAAVSNYDSRGYSCKLADFGLSRVMENNSTHVSTSTFGTAA